MNRTERSPAVWVGAVTFAILAVFALILVGSFARWRMRLARDVGRHLQAMKSAGMPTSGAELDRWYPAVPNERNGALVMTQAFALLRTYPDERSNQIANFRRAGRSYSLTQHEKDLLADYVDMNRAALAKVRESFSLPESRYPVDLTLGFDAPLSHLERIRTLAYVEEFETLLALGSDEMAHATASVISIMKMARTLEREPLLRSQLTRISLIRTGVHALELRMGAAALSEAELADLESSFGVAEGTNLLVRGLMGDRAASIPYFRMSWPEIQRRASDGEPGSKPISGPPLPGREPGLVRLTGFFERDLNFYLAVMETNIALTQQGPPRSLQLTNLDGVAEASRMKYVFSLIFLPSPSRTVLREADTFADARLARTALAVEAFRLAEGRLPRRLAELVPRFIPSVPPDPYDGALLRYRLLPKGYVIYSIGRDGHDDGGREKPQSTKSSAKASYDITFTVER